MTAAGRPGVGTIVAALLLPPLGVFLRDGLERRFWIATGLTVLGYVPGVAYALYVLFARPAATGEGRVAAA